MLGRNRQTVISDRLSVCVQGTIKILSQIGQDTAITEQQIRVVKNQLEKIDRLKKVGHGAQPKSCRFHLCSVSVVLYVKLGIALGLPSTAPVRLSPVILPKADLYSKGGSCKLSTSFLLPSAAAAGVPGGTRASGVQSHRHRGGHEEGGEGHGPREAGGAARHVQTFHRHRGPHGRHHYDPYVGLARCLFCSECMFKLLVKLSLFGFHLLILFLRCFSLSLKQFLFHSVKMY